MANRKSGFADTSRKYAAILLPVIREVARRHGYAIAVHGSLEYDIDLVAIPWTESVAGNPTDAQSLYEAVKKLCFAVTGMEYVGSQDGPTLKPHGRIAYSIHLGGGPYIDLSIMPRVIPPTPEAVNA